MDQELLRTKLVRPSVAPDIVARDRLIKRLDQARNRPLTLISAPAGYGKSTLASRWVAICDCPCAWVSLDNGDDDPRQFLGYLLAAIQQCFPEFDLRTKIFLNADRPLPADQLARYLLNDLHQMPEPFILVLDDYQCISDPAIHDFTATLLEHPAPAMHLMLLTRHDPPISLAALRGRGLLTEIRAPDLRFTLHEAVTFMGRMLNVVVDDATASLLASKTEGWAVGLRLAGFYLRGRKDLKSRVRELSGRSGYIAEYLAAEVLSRQHPEMIAYLLETSILDRFCAPLCDQMHREPCGKPSELTADQFIQWLVNTNLFVIALDEEGYWFRYHHLFQAFLTGELRKRRTADLIADLHRAAGNWFAENDLIEEAIRHFLAAGENQAAVRLVLEHRYDLLNTIRYQSLDRWLALLPADLVSKAPLLVTTQAVIAWVGGQRGDVAKFTAQAKRLLETLSPESPEYPVLQGEVLTLHNLVCALNSEPSSAWINPHKALESMPEKALFFRMLAMVLVAICHQMKGDLDQGVRLLKNELETADLPMSIQASCWFYLCIVNYLDCNTSETLLSGLKSLEIAENRQLAHTKGITKYFIGATYYQHNDLTKAKSYLSGVLEDRALTNLSYVTQAIAILGFIYLREGRPEKAQSMIDQSADSGWVMEDHHSPELRKALRVELALRRGMADEARRLSLDVDFDTLPPSWFVYMPQLTKVKLLLADGSEQSLEDARSRLAAMDRKMRGINRKCLRIDILALLALVCHRRNEHADATEHLRTAIGLAEPHGWIRAFLDLGEPMVDLLTFFIRHQADPSAAQRVLEACQAAHRDKEPSRPDAPTERFFEQPLQYILTRRETEILPLLAEGLNNNEIADRLCIAPVTVKKHLQNIFKKLGAKNRLEALKKSHEIGVVTQSKPATYKDPSA
jgi:LuxR family maltose regulon positive regulatory protein